VTGLYVVSWVGLEVSEAVPAAAKISWIGVAVSSSGNAAARISFFGTEVLYEFTAITFLKTSWFGLEVLFGGVKNLDELLGDYFVPPVAPTIESAVTFNSNVNDPNLTDEWDDTSSEGLHQVVGTYTLVWAVLKPDEYDDIQRFLVVKRGIKPFKYTIPSESTERAFKCKTWDKTYLGGTYSLKAEFREVFDLINYVLPREELTRAKPCWFGVEVLRSLG
jgi:phage-related protein